MRHRNPAKIQSIPEIFPKIKILAGEAAKLSMSFSTESAKSGLPILDMC